MSKWFITIPPMGGVRLVARHLIKAFDQCTDTNTIKTFDTLDYQSAFLKLLKNPSDEEMVVDLLNQSLVIQCLEFQPDYILVPALTPVTLFSLNLLKKYNIKTIHWFVEDFRRATYWKDILTGYDYFCAIQKNPFEQECNRIGSRFLFLPTATSVSKPVPVDKNITKTSDVVFVGIPSPYRISVLEYLAGQGISLVIAGSGWNGYKGILQKCISRNEWIEGSELESLMRSAKIGLNLSVDDPATDRANTHISPRVFDILASGLVLVTEEVPLIYENLPGAYFKVFKDTEEALSRIKSIIDKYDDEKKSLEKNYMSVMENHTYFHRIKKLMEVVTNGN